MNLRPVAAFLGRLLLVLAAAQALPLVVCLLYREGGGAVAFAASGVVAAACGSALAFLGRRPRGGDGAQVYRREGVLVVAGGWILASLFGALPYIFSATLVSPVDALFESASGFTTTGATVLLDIEAQGRGVLFWRSFTQWLGGMGIIVLFVALLPELGPGARFLYKLEVPGPTAEALRPRIRDTAAVLWRLYLTLTVAETVLLMLGGLDLYDALTHTFSTLSTGGFSPRADSVAAYDTPWVHLVVIVFMILAGGNFSLYYGLRTRRGWNVFRDVEFRLYLLIMGVASAVVFVDLLVQDVYASPFQMMLDSVFQVVSIMTTTGFATADFDQWPALSRLLLVGLMFVGGCAGSTAGSMKVMRMLIGLKAAVREVRLTFSPSTVVSIIVGGKPVPEPVVRSVAGFFILYLTSWGVGTLLLVTRPAAEAPVTPPAVEVARAADGAAPVDEAAAGTQVPEQEVPVPATGAPLDEGPLPGLVTAATASIATLGNIGPGLEAVGAVRNYAFFSLEEKLVMVLLMWLGRLEVYSIAALFTLRFWRR